MLGSANPHGLEFLLYLGLLESGKLHSPGRGGIKVLKYAAGFANDNENLTKAQQASGECSWVCG
jgi:hypothetical protein